ncbi:MAG: hypothetical protein H5U37_00575 [Caldisericia bacterium]|nr:hypothetical protein [Caldisericia bacterium]
MLSKEIVKDVSDKFIKDIFIASLSFYIDQGVNIFDSLKYAFYISTKSNPDKISIPKNIVEAEREMVLREI